MNETNDKKTNPSSGRWMLLLLFLFFAVPLLVVFAMYQFDWHPKGKSNGELISPARLIHIPQGLLQDNQKVVDKSVWNDKWNMVYVAEVCDERCEQQLYQMRQIHVSLAKEIERVQRVLITSQIDITSLKKKYPDLIVINQPSDQLLKLTEQFILDKSANGVTKGNEIFLVDPLGHLMMHYSKQTEPKLIRADITRLLKYSWAG